MWKTILCLAEPLCPWPVHIKCHYPNYCYKQSDGTNSHNAAQWLELSSSTISAQAGTPPHISCFSRSDFICRQLRRLRCQIFSCFENLGMLHCHLLLWLLAEMCEQEHLKRFWLCDREHLPNLYIFFATYSQIPQLRRWWYNDTH